MEQQEGKSKSLTLEEKLKLIELVESGRTIKDVSEEFAINRNTLHFIVKHKEKIRGSLIANPGIKGYKRIRPTRSNELEQKILDFMATSKNNRQKLSGNTIKVVALDLAAKLGVQSFAASNGWLCSFLKRNKLLMKDFNGSGSNDAEEAIRDESSDNIEKVAPSQFHVIENIVKLESSQETKSSELRNDYEGDISYDETDYFEESEVNEEPDVSAQEYPAGNWRNWCRLCGSCTTLPDVENFSQAISQVFKVRELLYCEVSIREFNFLL